MKALTKLIQMKIDEGKSLRQIAIDSGVEYTSISNYYHRNVEPRGKNLGLLAEYFRIPFHVLLDDYIPQHLSEMLSPTQQELVEIAGDATDDEASLLLEFFHTLKTRRKPIAHDESSEP